MASRIINPKKDTVSMIGHFSAELGVGEAGRRLSHLLTASGLQTNLVDFRGSKSRKLDRSVNIESNIKNSETIISCVNADQIAFTTSLYKIPHYPDSRHIAFWSWELESFPKGFKPATKLVDEIWTVSDFSKNSIAGQTDTPVKRIKLPVPIPQPRRKLRDYFKLQLSDRVALLNFDFSSDIERKNVRNSVAAYELAFPRHGDSKLIVKSINFDKTNPEHIEIWELCNSREDILWMPNYLSRAEVSELTSVVDVYLSLHRSEGYGLNLADAMARSIPVIATGYSGNLEFMSESSAVLIDYRLVPVTKYGGFEVDSLWAEPDVEQAANQLRRLLGNSDLARQIGEAGLVNIVNNHSLGAAAEDFWRNNFNG